MGHYEDIFTVFYPCKNCEIDMLELFGEHKSSYRTFCSGECAIEYFKDNSKECTVCGKKHIRNHTTCSTKCTDKKNNKKKPTKPNVVEICIKYDHKEELKKFAKSINMSCYWSNQERVWLVRPKKGKLKSESVEQLKQKVVVKLKGDCKLIRIDETGTVQKSVSIG